MCKVSLKNFQPFRIHPEGAFKAPSCPFCALICLMCCIGLTFSHRSIFILSSGPAAPRFSIFCTFYKIRWRNRTFNFQTKSDTILESRKVFLTFTKKINKKKQKLIKLWTVKINDKKLSFCAKSLFPTIFIKSDKKMVEKFFLGFFYRIQSINSQVTQKL